MKSIFSSQLVEKANLEQQVIKIAYKVGQDFTEAKEKFLETNANWSVLTESGVDGSSQFKAVAFLNKTTHEVLIPHAGTAVSTDLKQSAHDIWADTQLAARITPELKLEAIKAFITKIQSKLPELPKGESYSISTTGHSLGGTLADLTAAEALSRGLKVTNSRTFDNPGSLPIIKDALAKKLFTNNNFTIESLKEKIDFVSIQAQKPNVISRCNEQIGETYIKVKTTNKNDLGQKTNSKDVSIEDSGANYVSYLFSKVGSAAKQTAPFLNLKNITTSYKSISKYYELENFDKMKENVQAVKEGLIQKIREDFAQPFEDTKQDVVNITSDLLKIGSAVASVSANSLTNIISMTQGASSLMGNVSSFSKHTIEAYNKLAVFADSITAVQGHALSNFENINENNIFKVESGAWAEGVQLSVHANQHNIDAMKKLKELKATKEQIAKAEIAPEEQKQGSYFSWAYNKVSNAARTIKDTVSSHTKDLTDSVKVMIGEGESIILSHQELADFCANTSCSIIPEDIMMAGITA